MFVFVGGQGRQSGQVMRASVCVVLCDSVESVDDHLQLHRGAGGTGGAQGFLVMYRSGLVMDSDPATLHPSPFNLTFFTFTPG